MANGSRLHREHVAHFWNGLSVLQPIGHHAQRKCFRPFNGLFARLTVRQDAWQFRHLRDPAAIVFAFDLNPQHQSGLS